MTLTRRELISALTDGEERSFLKHQPSNIPVGIQLENFRTTNRALLRRSGVVITTTPQDVKIPEPANDNLLREMARDIIDLPIPKSKRKGWKVFLWVVTGLVIVFKCYKIVRFIYDHIRG